MNHTNDYPKYVYVAGKWEEKERISKIMDCLRNNGYFISYDWTKHKDGDDEERCALNDRLGVQSCDFIIAIVDKPLSYCGTLIEIGIALGLRKPVYLFGDHIDSCIFSTLCFKVKDICGKTEF